MGIGYSTSALHQISYLEPIPGAPPSAEPIPDFLRGMPGVIWDPRPLRFVSPSKAEIVAWRRRIAARYRSQLGEELYWDEDDEFEQSEDQPTSSPVQLGYVTAVLDRVGTDEAARALAGMPKPSHDVMDPEFAVAERRGFTGQFPQMLLGAAYWLPFRRNMIIEEPTWRGDLARFGSSHALAVEIAAVRRFIATVDPRATAWTQQTTDDPPDVLAAAWQASDTVARLCDVALSRGLPFWTTG